MVFIWNTTQTHYKNQKPFNELFSTNTLNLFPTLMKLSFPAFCFVSLLLLVDDSNKARINLSLDSQIKDSRDICSASLFFSTNWVWKKNQIKCFHLPCDKHPLTEFCPMEFSKKTQIFPFPTDQESPPLQCGYFTLWGWPVHQGTEFLKLFRFKCPEPTTGQCSSASAVFSRAVARPHSPSRSTLPLRSAGWWNPRHLSGSCERPA